MNIISAGGVVYRIKDDVIEVKLITTKSWKYTLPKGRVEANDSVEDTAIREVKEEAGVEATIEASLGTVEWELRNGGIKTVYIFLMKCISDGPVNDPDNEIIKAGWKSLDDAIKLVDFPPMRKMLFYAVKLLDKKRSDLCVSCFSRDAKNLDWCEQCLENAKKALEKKNAKKFLKGTK